MSIIDHNRDAWDRESAEGSEWSTPVDSETIDAARKGNWSVILTPNKSVPRDWFGDLNGKRVLCLASGGGQQVPTFAAAGADVVSFDFSRGQLTKDQMVAERDGLSLKCVEGDMRDLSAFSDEQFELIFHPTSNAFIPDVANVWRECSRVLCKGGELLSGFLNPAYFLFDHEAALEGAPLVVKYPLPYAEPDSLKGEVKERWIKSREAALFSHSLESQIGGQIDAGFAIVGFYEDTWSDEATPLNRFSPTSIATRARKGSQRP
jgi:SAM-dependent methyltransferase